MSPRAAVTLLALAACTRDKPGPACTLGEVRCTDAGVQLCDSGGAWRDGSCADGQKCVAGTCGDPATCPDVCKDILCEPGARVCASDNLYIYECDETGTALRACASCAAPPVSGACSAGHCISLCNLHEKSYIGCEYYAIDLDNARLFSGIDQFGAETYLDAQNAQYAVVISNPDPFMSVLVSVTTGPSNNPPPGESCAEPAPDPNFVDAAIVPPKGIHTFLLPPRNVDGTSIAPRAYRVASSLPIIAYQFNPLENVDVFSNDASLLLPANALGTDYYVMTRSQTFEELKGYVAVAGIDPAGTEVTVTVTAPTLGGVDIPAMQPGDSFTATLQQYDVLNIETDAIGADLTGSFVHASKPVAVFGGSEAANAPTTSRCNLATHKCEYDGTTDCSCAPNEGRCFPDAKCSRFITCCADHLEMQLFPITTWGTEYLAVKSFPRGNEKDVWRILARDNGTVVTFDPPIASVPVLDAGAWFELEAAEDFAVNASAPVLVGQFLAAQDAPNPGKQPGDAGIGDPSFMLATPLRQLRDDYVFLVPDKYARDYVSIAAPDGTAVTLDGTSAEALPLVMTASIGASGWRALRVPIADGYHHLECSAPCSVMVHGYDRYVSYGYPGGLNLEDAP